jgi:rhodanese-related sulfurtransferase
MDPMTVEELLTEARAGLRRLAPGAAAQAARDGAVLVDIRPAAVRAAEGEVPGALVVERNVLEWRFAPTSAWRVPQAGPDVIVVVVCNDGFTSSLAAHALRRLGVHRATDLVGGFRAWRAAGLPTVPGPSPAIP